MMILDLLASEHKVAGTIQTIKTQITAGGGCYKEYG